MTTEHQRRQRPWWVVVLLVVAIVLSLCAVALPLWLVSLMQQVPSASVGEGPQRVVFIALGAFLSFAMLAGFAWAALIVVHVQRRRSR
jgi:hypothetical protein